MFETMRIRRNMEVVGQTGQRLGTVSGIVDDLILLARSSAGDLHHCVPLHRVATIDETRICLK
jgi:hypothetical protein